MSRDEVRITVSESGGSDKGYWDLRKHREPEYRVGERDRSQDSGRNEIRIDFDLEETRQMDENQKQAILDTMLSGDSPNSEPGSSRNNSWRNMVPESGVIPFLALLAFLAVLIIVFLGLAGGSCYL